jgi:accessory gene regulator protein AgrB
MIYYDRHLSHILWVFYSASLLVSVLRYAEDKFTLHPIVRSEIVYRYKGKEMKGFV